MITVTATALEHLAQLLSECDDATTMRVEISDDAPRLVEGELHTDDEVVTHNGRIVLALAPEIATSMTGTTLNAVHLGDDTMITLE